MQRNNINLTKEGDSFNVSLSDLPNEEWRDVEGYSGKYHVSNMGRVKSFSYHQERILRAHLSIWGYAFVTLHKNGKPKIMTIHRLVATAFIPNCKNAPEINHKDENRQNNHADNLEWCDRFYNANYGKRMDKIKNALSHQIEQYTKEGKLVAIYQSMKEAARKNNLCSSNIARCANGKRKFCGGYRWEKSNIEEQ